MSGKDEQGSSLEGHWVLPQVVPTHLALPQGNSSQPCGAWMRLLCAQIIFLCT